MPGIIKEEKDIKKQFINWMNKNVFNQSIFIYPSSDDVNSLKDRKKSNGLYDDEIKETLRRNYFSLVRPVNFQISWANDKWNVKLERLENDDGKYLPALKKKKLKTVMNVRRLINLRTELAKEKATYFDGNESYKNLAFPNKLCELLNKAIQGILWENAAEKTNENTKEKKVAISNINKCKRLFKQLKDIITKAKIFEKEVGDYGPDSNKLLVRHSKAGKLTRFLRRLTGKGNYNNLSKKSDDKGDAKYTLENLREKSKKYRNQLKLYLEMSNPNLSKEEHVLVRRMARLQTLLVQWKKYFTIKPASEGARNEILDKLNNLIKKLQENAPPKKNSEDVGNLDMKNLSEIETFVKDWSEIKVMSKAKYNIKNKGLWGFIKGLSMLATTGLDTI